MEYYTPKLLIFVKELTNSFCMSVPKILVAARQAVRKRGLSKHTEKAYLEWIYRFLIFHHTLSRGELTDKEIGTFLSFQAVSKRAPSSTQNQALHALLFLYRHVFNQKVAKIRFIHLKSRQDFPLILTREETRKILGLLSGEKKLIISLLYGCGLRLNECLSLRIQDINLENNILHIRNFRTEENRDLCIPETLKEALQTRIETLRYRFMHLSIHAYCGVSLPETVKKTRPDAACLFLWFYLFPTLKPVKPAGIGKECFHHRSETYVQKAIRKALKEAGITKNVSCRTFRHSFAIHLLEGGKDIYHVQKLLGHKNIRNTLVYKHMLNNQSRIPDNPLDSL